MPQFSNELIDEVRQSNDIVDVISQYMALKRSGRNYFGLCPFHNEKSPSFSVSPDKQIFHCFGCGVGGDVFTFISKIEGISFFEAMQSLAERANITIPSTSMNYDSKKEKLKEKIYKINEFAAEYYNKKLYDKTSKIAQEYIKKRKLTNKTLIDFKIGFSGNFNELYQELIKNGFDELEILESGLVNKNDNGKFIDRYRNRLMFPICDVRGRVIGFGGRVLDDSKPKYINSPENLVYSKGRHLYGLNVAKKNKMTKLLIVEGYMDVISLHQRGITNVVAALGTALTEQQGYLLRKSTEQVILSFDSDGAGQNAIMRSIDILQNMGCDIRILQMDGAKDPDEYILKYGSARFQNLMDNAISVIEFKVKQFKEKLNIENPNDKIKFLNEIAKLISKINSSIEREVYIDNISKKYNISKESIYAEVNKLIYKNSKGQDILDNKKIIIKKDSKDNLDMKNNDSKKENAIISLLLIGDKDIYTIIKNNIRVNELKNSINKEIVELLYKEYEKNSVNINNILNELNEEQKGYVSKLMIDEYEIENKQKAVKDIIQSYKKEKLLDRKKEILELLEVEKNKEEKKKLEDELKNIIINIVNIK